MLPYEATLFMYRRHSPSIFGSSHAWHANKSWFLINLGSLLILWSMQRSKDSSWLVQVTSLAYRHSSLHSPPTDPTPCLLHVTDTPTSVGHPFKQLTKKLKLHNFIIFHYSRHDVTAGHSPRFSHLHEFIPSLAASSFQSIPHRSRKWFCIKSRRNAWRGLRWIFKTLVPALTRVESVSKILESHSLSIPKRATNGPMRKQLVRPRNSSALPK